MSIAEKETSFYHTEDPSIASELGLTSKIQDSGIALFRHYPKHPSTTVHFTGHKASEAKNGTLLDNFRAFFHAEKLPEFIPYIDAIEDHGHLIMSVPIQNHVRHTIGGDGRGN